MRIVEPKTPSNSTEITRRKKHSFKFYLSVVVVIIIAASIAVVASKREPVASPTEQQQAVESDTTNKEVEQTETYEFSREFSGNEFRLLFDYLLQPNTIQVPIAPPITGDDVADTRIRELAESRGYKLRSSPIQTLPVIDGYPLQASVGDDWFMLKRAAQSAGLGLSITSGYRTVDEQRVLFMRELRNLGVTIRDIISGNADAEIDTILVTTAVPGYSKHHTGYTIDLLCSGYAFENFKNSTCHEWLSANNFEIAKQHGFIPSYPLDADLQGPDPEAWEYVWVGTGVLYPDL